MADAPQGSLLTVEQAAQYLSVSTDFVYKRSAAGALPCVKLGRALRFRRGDLDAWVAKHVHGPTEH